MPTHGTTRSTEVRRRAGESASPNSCLASRNQTSTAHRPAYRSSSVRTRTVASVQKKTRNGTAPVVQRVTTTRTRHVPVTRGQKLVGIVSRANLLHALAGLARDIKPATAGDQGIRERLLAELGRQSWAPAALINVIVKDGTVELWGTITDDRERQAVMVAAENVPGVQAVRDHLVWIEPTSGMAIYSSDDDPAQAKAS